MNPAYQRVLFVMNPISGDLDKAHLQEKLRAFSERRHLDHDFFLTTGQNDRAHIEARLATWRPDLVVTVGGDGTVNLVGSLLADATREPPPALGIIPFGSGNGLAKDLDIPQETDAALKLLAEGRAVPMDVVEINGETSLHLADIGFNAQMIKNFDASGVRGPAAYAWQTARTYVNYEPTPFEIVTPEQCYRGRAFMVTVANANMFGTNTTINPDGEVDDGWFEVCVLEAFPKAAGLGILYRLYREEIDESAYARVIRCREVEIFNQGEAWLQIDGELKGRPPHIKAHVRAGVLPVIRPVR
ncbi:MAG: diacylglycerol kinase family protein [Catalinimonas sp.]